MRNEPHFVDDLPAVIYRFETESGEAEQRLWYADTGASVKLASGEMRAGVAGVNEAGSAVYLSREVGDTGQEALHRLRLPQLSFEQLGEAYAEVTMCRDGLSADEQRVMYTARKADEESPRLMLHDIRRGSAVALTEARSGGCRSSRKSASFARGYLESLDGELSVWNGTEILRPFGDSAAARVIPSPDWEYLLVVLPDEGRLVRFSFATGEVETLFEGASLGGAPRSELPYAFWNKNDGSECFEECIGEYCSERCTSEAYAIVGPWTAQPRVELLDEHATSIEYAGEGRVLLKSASTADGAFSETVETLRLYE
jgi:hypothetical protein